MESLAKSDIFFFVTTICVVLITTLVLMILWHVLHIVKKARKTVDFIHGETDGFARDFAAFRSYLRENQFGMKPIVDGIKKGVESVSGTPKKPRPKKPKPEEPATTM